MLQARQIWEALLYAQPGVRESDAGAAAFETLVSFVTAVVLLKFLHILCWVHGTGISG